MNFWSLWIPLVVIGGLALEFVVEGLNLRVLQVQVPREFEGLYNEEKYAESQRYLRRSTRFELFQSALSVALLLSLIYGGAFAWLQGLSSELSVRPVVQGLVFFAVLGTGIWLWGLPFAIYDTFVIEEHFGFNRTTPKLFIQDQLRGALLAVLIGVPLLAGLLAFFEYAGHLAWLWAWIAVIVFQILLSFVAPVWIMPLFNKFTPLAEGTLKSEIENYAHGQNFALQGIFTMDGSKRSSKANAFFTGFGRFRRIVLFDTLVEKHSVEELVAVLAHEIGHFRKRHVLKGLVFSILTTGLLLAVFAWLAHSDSLAQAFGLEHASLAANMAFFGIVYAPISSLFSLWTLWRSRVHEFEADEFAVRSYGKPEALANALKKLSVDSLSNLCPHPLKVFFEYTHPPVLERVARMRSL
jgi:STE24 endopeptidase